MTTDDFWKLLEGLPLGPGAEDALRDRLAALGPKQIAEFQGQFDVQYTRAYRWLLWAAAYIIEGGCSDDAFMDFRCGLISRGREVFEAALANPDSLVGPAGHEGDDADLFNEAFGYVAGEIYEEKTGNEMPRTEVEHPSDPQGEEWDFDDEDLCAIKLPKLWAKFGE
jgi:hypothetical protein